MGSEAKWVLHTDRKSALEKVLEEMLKTKSMTVAEAGDYMVWRPG